MKPVLPVPVVFLAVALVFFQSRTATAQKSAAEVPRTFEEEVKGAGFRRPVLGAPEEFRRLQQERRILPPSRVAPVVRKRPSGEEAVGPIAAGIPRAAVIERARQAAKNHNLAPEAGQLFRKAGDARNFWKWEFADEREFGDVCIDSTTGKLLRLTRISLADAKASALESPEFSTETAVDLAENFLKAQNVSLPEGAKPVVAINVIGRDGNNVRRLASVSWRKSVQGIPCLDSFIVVTVDPCGPKVIGFSDGADLEVERTTPQVSRQAALDFSREGSTTTAAREHATARLYVINKGLHPFFEASSVGGEIVWVVGKDADSERPALSEVAIIHAQTGEILRPARKPQ